ncbi:MAG: hypothetical protein ACI8UO_001803 [Verrucomicrobiales bacterium]|jgi:hypothetical protein
MNPTLLLTVFLFAAGVFTAICAFAKYDWFLKNEELQKSMLFRIIGEKGIRAFFILIGVACITWGIVRVMDPPREIPADFLFELAKPA